MLTSLLYVSAARRLWAPSDLTALLRASRARNAGDGITGLLLYHEGVFMQYIEGPPPAVQALHERLHADERHRNLLVLHRSERAQRLFPHWLMGFHRADDLASGTDGITSFLRRSHRDPESPDRTDTRVLRLLTSFRQHFTPAHVHSLGPLPRTAAM